jgi:hypothetical protein
MQPFKSPELAQRFLAAAQDTFKSSGISARFVFSANRHRSLSPNKAYDTRDHL